MNGPTACRVWVILGLALVAAAPRAAAGADDSPDAGLSGDAATAAPLDAAPADAAATAPLPPPLATESEVVPPPPIWTATEPAQKPLYARWWFWTGIGAVVVGGVVAALLLTHTPDRPGCPVAMGYQCP